LTLTERVLDEDFTASYIVFLAHQW